MKLFWIISSLIMLAACSENAPQPSQSNSAQGPQPGDQVQETVSAPVPSLELVLAAQPDKVRSRYAHRNPQQTLEFFGLEPGMTVVEALPGGGWYSKILLSALGPDGHLTGVNYAQELWPNFGFANEEFLNSIKTWTTDWPQQANEWRDENSASVSAFEFGSLDESQRGSADMVLLIRALHNMARFEGGFLDQAIADSYNILKPGGVVGIVQHQARESMPDSWANGANGYLKKSDIVARMEAQGFDFVAESPINQNALDLPTENDIVWRLPPSLRTSQDNPELKAAMQAIGESHRMTLKFVKPVT